MLQATKVPSRQAISLAPATVRALVDKGEIARCACCGGLSTSEWECVDDNIKYAGRPGLCPWCRGSVAAPFGEAA